MCVLEEKVSEMRFCLFFRDVGVYGSRAWCRCVSSGDHPPNVLQISKQRHQHIFRYTDRLIQVLNNYGRKLTKVTIIPNILAMTQQHPGNYPERCNQNQLSPNHLNPPQNLRSNLSHASHFRLNRLHLNPSPNLTQSLWILHKL